MRWVTQEHVQIARLASAWLIRRFIDPEAEFAFVPRGTELASIKDGTPFHLQGAKLFNREGKNTFEVIVDTYHLAEREPVLEELGQIVRSADRLHNQVAFRGVPMREAVSSETPAEAPGLQALLHGSGLVASGDLDAIDRATASLDAMFASLRARREPPPERSAQRRE